MVQSIEDAKPRFPRRIENLRHVGNPRRDAGL
jgi:hypothetical protein